MNLQGLDRALSGLGPYLADIVLCGGWAWYLYRRCLGVPRPIESQFTRDLDCIAESRMRVRDQPAVRRLEEAGFQWSPKRGHQPPAACFAWPNPDEPLAEVEFLTAARGDGSRPTEEIQEGLVAQTLRYLDILTDSPLSLMISECRPLSQEVTFRGAIRLPQVGSFAIQKALIVTGRSREKQVKDFFYVADLIDAVNGLSERLLVDVIRAGGEWPSQVETFAAFLDRRVEQSVFLGEVSEQYPVEARPTDGYIREEVRRWSARLNTALGRRGSG